MLDKIVKQIIGGKAISYKEALLLINTDLKELKQGADQIRRHYCGNGFDLCSIINGKSGRCSEDCKYCAQSSHYSTNIKTYDLIDENEAISMALYNQNKGVKRFSIVTSGRTVNDKEFDQLANIYHNLKQSCHISLCASLGLLNREQFQKLKKLGVQRYHNNLETSRNYFKNICTTHTYDQKIMTIKNAKAAKLEICSGGIMGMGESWQDRIDLAFTLKDLEVKSIPINILNPIANTPLEHQKPLSKEEVERIFAIYRFINPDATIRMAGGRGLFDDHGISVFKSGANGAITGDMLTTPGITIDEDQRIIKELGFEVVK